MTHYRVALYELRKENGKLQAKVIAETHKDMPRLDTGMQRSLMGHAWARYVRISECGYGDDKCRQYEDELEKPLEAVTP